MEASFSTRLTPCVHGTPPPHSPTTPLTPHAPCLSIRSGFNKREWLAPICPPNHIHVTTANLYLGWGPRRGRSSDRHGACEQAIEWWGGLREWRLCMRDLCVCVCVRVRAHKGRGGDVARPVQVHWMGASAHVPMHNSTCPPMSQHQARNPALHHLPTPTPTHPPPCRVVRGSRGMRGRPPHSQSIGQRWRRSVHCEWGAGR